MLKSGHRNTRLALKRLACYMGIVGMLSAASIVQVQASASCDAVNSGAFELTGTALGPSSSSILTSWAVGDVLTVNITSADGLSRTDGLYHGPTFTVGSFGPLATGTVPSSGTLTFQYTVTSTDLTNGIAIDPENNDSVVVGCGPAPTITANGVSPNTGSTSGGTSVTITGSGFTGVTTGVTFGGTAASFTVNNSSQITATTPAHTAGSVDVAVITGAGTATASAAFTYVPPPTVTGIAPNKGSTAGGTSVVITGTNFTGATLVNFGTGSASFTVNSATQITATSPGANAGAVDVTVTAPVGTSATSAADRFAYFPPPTVTSIAPNNGPIVGATAVTITGANFTGATAVKFGSNSASFTVTSATQIAANSPAGSAGTVDVTVTTPGGTSATSASDQFSYGSSQTWVSSFGSDSNTCARAAPCQTFNGAMASTIPGGEINVLDPGDFGPLTITRAISIYNDAFGVGGIIPGPATSGIIINAGVKDVVNMRGLLLDGATASGTSGIVFNSGAGLNIENCVIQGFSGPGIELLPGVGSASAARFSVHNTSILNNGTGVLIKPTGGIAATAAIQGITINNNLGGGLRVDGTGGSGAVNVTIADSSVSFNTSNGINAVSGLGNVTVDIMRVIVQSNGSSGIQSNQGNGGTASVTVGSSMIRGNIVGVTAIGGASSLSYSNNQVTGNNSNGSFTGGAVFQ
jgi:IPT/TIG domain